MYGEQFIMTGTDKTSAEGEGEQLTEEVESTQNALVNHGIWNRAEAIGLRDEGDCKDRVIMVEDLSRGLEEKQTSPVGLPCLFVAWVSGKLEPFPEIREHRRCGL